MGDGVPHLRVAEAKNATFSGELVLSLMTRLRLGLIEALQLVAEGDPTDSNPLLQQPNHLRELRFYKTGLAQLNLLAKSERSKIASLCLDMMPGLLYPASTSPDYTVCNASFTYALLLDKLGLKGAHEAVHVRFFLSPPLTAFLSL